MTLYAHHLSRQCCAQLRSSRSGTASYPLTPASAQKPTPRVRVATEEPRPHELEAPTATRYTRVTTIFPSRIVLLRSILRPLSHNSTRPSSSQCPPSCSEVSSDQSLIIRTSRRTAPNRIRTTLGQRRSCITHAQSSRTAEWHHRTSNNTGSHFRLVLLSGPPLEERSAACDQLCRRPATDSQPLPRPEPPTGYHHAVASSVTKIKRKLGTGHPALQIADLERRWRG